MVRGSDGARIALVSVRLARHNDILSTQLDPVADVPHVDQIRSKMDFVASLNLGTHVVHLIDREADSVGHWRDGTKAGHRALVRADDRLVRHGDRERKLVEIADERNAQGGLKSAGKALESLHNSGWAA